MLNFEDFFVTCSGTWTTERIYHSTLTGEVERSFTEFRVQQITQEQKQKILSLSELGGIKVDLDNPQAVFPGFSIAFDTVSEKGEKVSMSLQALFVADTYVLETSGSATEIPPPPLAAQVVNAPDTELLTGFYLRDEGYSEAGAIAGRFTYQTTRQTLEMTTYYRRSVAVDQMRLISPDMRLRTIVTYERPSIGEQPTIIDLVGFGVERRQAA